MALKRGFLFSKGVGLIGINFRLCKYRRFTNMNKKYVISVICLHFRSERDIVSVNCNVQLTSLDHLLLFGKNV